MLMGFFLALFPQIASPEPDWSTARASLGPRLQVGLDFLLAHMPEQDRRELSSEWVVEHLKSAYAAWEATPWKDQVPQAVFLNEVLPYASVNEHRDAWREDFHQRFAPLVKDAKSPREAAAILNQQIFTLLKVEYSTQRPKADQSPYESIKAGMASCTGLSILLVDACRSVGVPARFVGTPLWADGSGNHSWVEIWDEGWHFTGAAEPTGNELNQAWFAGRASQAKADDPERAIFAVSYKKTPQSFPMVWAPDLNFVHAVNVTHRYVQEPPVPKGHARIRFLVLDKEGKRIPSGVKIRDKTGKVLHAGRTKDESFDANDHYTVVLPKGEWIDVMLRGVRQMVRTTFAVEEDETMVRVVFGENILTEVLKPKQQLWREHVKKTKATRGAEMKARVLQMGSLEMPFWYTTFGKKPKGGRSLWISMHGGGGAPKKVNDQQWENQKKLYQLKEGVYVAPRAPTDTWNLWHQKHMDGFLDRLIENMIVFEDVNPDRVYIMGYSAGGDGVYQLAPRMADRFAAAAMMAGHPNETKPDGLRNLPFTLHMGAEDSAYDRNKIAAQWQEKLAALQKGDEGGYAHWVEIYQGKGHWMDREDAAALPWMAKYSRNLRPEKVVWLQDDVTHRQFYWLAVEEPSKGSKLVVERDGQVFRILEADGISQLSLLLDGEMVDFSKEILVFYGEEQIFRAKVQKSMDVMRRSLSERGDFGGIWEAVIRLNLATRK
jgi:hypothetical protein